MFQNLTDRLGSVFGKLRGRGALSEADVKAAMREVRIALLEADVALPVVKDFVQRVTERAVGQDVLKSVTPAQQVIKIVNDQLTQLLEHEAQSLNLAAVSPVVIMMAGLQGSGKTTSAAKLAQFIQKKQRKKSLMASLDIYRPAAQKQLEILGESIGVETLEIIPEQKPVEIAKRALEKAKLEAYDVLILDTAGRLHIDDELMQELEAVKSLTSPTETFLVADAMSGQDAVITAQTFHERIGVTGIILTRIDGDARGGAALSMKSVTGCPIKFLGSGEQVDKFEEFHPERIAGRILDMGDVVTLVEKAAENIDQQEAEKLAQKMQRGTFDLDDLATQLRQMEKIGGLGGIMSMMPGMGKLKDKMAAGGIDDSMLKRQVAVISSMTKQERRHYKLLNASRRKRVAAGSGTSVQEVNRLMKQFMQMSKMMKRMGKMDKKRLSRHDLKGLLS